LEPLLNQVMEEVTLPSRRQQHAYGEGTGSEDR